MDMDKLFDGIYNIQKELKSIKSELSEFKSEMTDFKNEMTDFKNEMTDFKSEVRNEFKKVNDRLGHIESSIEILARKSFENETNIYHLKKQVEHTVYEKPEGR